MRKLILFLILALLIVGAYFLSSMSYSDGERAGTISKFSKRGYVFKTHEGQLNEGGFSGETGTLTPKYWDFTVLDSQDSIVKKMEHALRIGTRVTLKYEERLFKFPWVGDTKYIVKDVMFLSGGPDKGVFNNAEAATTASDAASATATAVAGAATAAATTRVDTIRQVVVIDTIVSSKAVKK